MKQISIIGLLLALLVFSASIFVVNQTQRVLKLRLGKIVTQQNEGEAQAHVYGPGLHFKIPLMESILKFDARLQTLEVQSSRILTQEKKDVEVDFYIMWRILDFPTFFKRTTGNFTRAEKLLRQKVIDGLRAEFGRRTIKDVVSGERYDVMSDILTAVKDVAANIGILVEDVRIKRIDLPKEVSEAVYARMRTERERIAAEHRAQGKEKAEAISANADRKVTVIHAEAEKKALEIRGEGDAVAAKIYADSYSQDEEFYAFYRSLEAYTQSFSSNQDLLVINPNSDFFKYLRTPNKPKEE